MQYHIQTEHVNIALIRAIPSNAHVNRSDRNYSLANQIEICAIQMYLD